MFKKIGFTLLVMVLVVGSLGAIKVTQIKALIAAGENMQAPKETVSSYVAREEVWKTSLSAVGTFKSVQGVALSTEVSGVVTRILFESGQSVKEGDLLVELDVSSEKAELQAAEARLELARLKRDRSRELHGKNTVAQSEVDVADAEFLESEAQLRNIESVIAKKSVVAPFDGRLGIREVNLGQFLAAGSSVASLQSLDPIYLDFSLPQQQLGSVSEGMKVEARIDAYPEDLFEGEVTAVTPEVSVTTRSGGLRATFSNEKGKLRPGMFCNVSVVLPEERPVLVVPATAILYAPYSDSVYVIADDENGGQIVKQTFVRVLERRGDYVAIEAGIEAGDTVVATGVFKLRHGMGVFINNDLRPQTSMNPKPEDA